MQRFEKWTDTYLKLVNADQEHALEPKDLETLALSAYLTGRDSESLYILERAHHGFLDLKELEKAARCAFWLGMMLMNAGERARSSGWIARGERILSEEQWPGCAENGLLLIPAALGEMYAGNSEKALKLFEEAEKIGLHFGDIDLIILGRLGHGQAMIKQGEVAKGIRLLDETMITIETVEVFPIVNGIVYCSVIETCRRVWDMERAKEWTLALSRWCDTQPDIVPFRGECLVHRAEIIQFHGEWPKALKETTDACKLLTRLPGEPAAGEAYYRKAELHRLMGDFEEAEDCYHEAAKWGRKPQPGLALLRMAQGQYDAAETSIRNTLQETKDIRRRSDLLPAVVIIMIAAKQTGEALQASKELLEIANKYNAPYLYAKSSYCHGAVFLAEGNVQLALEHLQKALKLWNALNLPYESALTRELRALCYRELNDKDNSEVELAVAKWVFEHLKAVPDLERVNRLLNKSKVHDTHGLTLREFQVLRLVASGKTNKSIAGELFISGRTVDRHVSNIFNKFDVSSRVEAIAFALRNKILDNDLL